VRHIERFGDLVHLPFAFELLDRRTFEQPDQDLDQFVNDGIIGAQMLELDDGGEAGDAAAAAIPARFDLTLH
jgi:hypothetical protein